MLARLLCGLTYHAPGSLFSCEAGSPQAFESEMLQVSSPAPFGSGLVLKSC